MSACPCGSAVEYEACCAPLIKAEKTAATAETLMRSRYTAYARTEMEYLLKTTHPSKRDAYDFGALRKWSEESDWRGLEIIKTEKGGEDDDAGTVEFIARYTEEGKKQEHHEVADFRKEDGQWFFYDGQAPRQTTYVRKSPKIGRNAPCPCNSGKKYKKCCGR